MNIEQKLKKVIEDNYVYYNTCYDSIVMDDRVEFDKKGAADFKKGANWAISNLFAWKDKLDSELLKEKKNIIVNVDGNIFSLNSVSQEEVDKLLTDSRAKFFILPE